MKTWITQLAASALAVAAISLSACKKDEVQATLTPTNSPTLSASTASAVLQSVNGTQTAVTYTWTPITFNWSGTESNKYSPAVTYSLQFDKKGNNFATPVSVDGGAGPTKALTVASLNGTLISLGLAPEVAAGVEVRLKATYANNITPLYSPTVALTATPYSTELYVSSSFLGNNLATAPKLLEIDGSPRQYQGYVYFGGSTASTFKVTNTRAGTGSFYGNSSTTAIAVGAAGVATTGTLQAPGSNFTIAPGYYLVNVNLANMTWSVTPYTWAIIGDATANGWNSDTPMTYNPTTNLWTVTTTLTANKFKFRANGKWDVSLGDTKPAGSYLTANGGENLASPGAGKYTISLDLSDYSKPTYTTK
ncbi:MAG: SusF/SusE family outer membrane protein [Hymenobacter sp.]|nr:MAG: SusF/SusE family outer membrane protein [Hymenobacter sp.]